jgi:hypothetical protein
VPDAGAPDVPAPEASAPEIGLPEVELPEVSVPDVKLPDISVPDVKLPDISVPDVKLPDISVPDVKLPDFSGFTVPKFGGFGEPRAGEIPEARPAEAEVPAFKIPNIGGGPKKPPSFGEGFKTKAPPAPEAAPAPEASIAETTTPEAPAPEAVSPETPVSEAPAPEMSVPTAAEPDVPAVPEIPAVPDVPDAPAAVPEVSMPEPPAAEISVPDAVDAPSFKVPEIDVPEFGVKIPEFSFSKPEGGFKLPDVGGFKLPEVKVPDVDISGLKLPEVKVPDVDISGLKLPEVKMPKVSLPEEAMPEASPEPVAATTSEAAVPEAAAPSPEVAAPVPEAAVPAPEVAAPVPEAAVPAPEVVPPVPEIELPPVAPEVDTGSAVDSVQGATSDTVEAARAGYENLTSSAQGGAEGALSAAQDTLNAASASKDQLLSNAQGGVDAAGAALDSVQDSIGSSLDSLTGAYEAAVDAIPPEIGEFFEFVAGKAVDNPQAAAGVGAVGAAYVAIPALVQLLRKVSPGAMLEGLAGDDPALLVDLRSLEVREQQGVPQLKLKQRGRAVVVEPVVLDRDTRRSVKSPKAMEEQIRAEYVAGLKEVQKARSVYVIDADGRSALPLVNRLHGLGVGQSRAVEGGVANLIREGYALEGDVAYRSGSLKVFADRVEGLKDQATSYTVETGGLAKVGGGVALAAAAAFQWHTVLEYIGVLGTLFLTWRYFAFGTSTEMQRDFEKVQGAAGAAAGVASGVLGVAGKAASAAREVSKSPEQPPATQNAPGTPEKEVAEAPKAAVEAVEAEPAEDSSSSLKGGEVEGEVGKGEMVSESAAEVEVVQKEEPSED